MRIWVENNCGLLICEKKKIRFLSFENKKSVSLCRILKQSGMNFSIEEEFSESIMII